MQDPLVPPGREGRRPDPASVAFVGRERELNALRAVLADARRGESRSVVLRGEAGIGKTALLAQMVAEADGMLVVQTRGTESEAHLVHAGLFDLCSPVTGAFARLAPHYQASLKGALAMAAPSGHDSFAVAVALLALFTEVARDTPVLIVVDDVQWLDASSAQCLAFMARRIRRERIAIVAAVRHGAPGDDRLDDIDALTVGGLPPEHVARVLTLHAGTPVDREVARRLTAASGGNPLALVELAAQLSRSQLSGGNAMPVHVGVGHGVSQLFEAELTHLPARTRRALGVAALWEGSLSELADPGVRPLDLDFDPADLEPAVAQGLVTVARDKVAFRHPLQRSAVIGLLGPVDTGAVHRHLAALARHEPQRRAFHLAAAIEPPDPEVARALEEAAAHAVEVGALTDAVDMYERAAQFGTDPAFRGTCLVNAAELAAQAGSTERAATLAARASALTADPATLATIDHLRGKMALYGAVAIPQGRKILQMALERAAAFDPVLFVRISVDATMLAVAAGDRGAAVELAQRAHRMAEDSAPSMLDVAALALAGARGFHSLDVDEHAVTAAHGRLLRAGGNLADVKTATEIVANGLIAREHYRTAQFVCENFILAARRRGAVGAVPLALALGAKAALYVDCWDAAAAAADEAHHLARESDQTFAESYALTWIAVTAALQGAEGAVARAATDIARLSAEVGIPVGIGIVAHARALTALGRDRFEEAATHLDEVSRHRRAQCAVADGLLHWEGDYAEALIRTGRETEAAGILEVLEERAASTTSAWAAIVAARSRALLAPDRGLDDAFGRAAAACMEGPEYQFERYRTERCWGERLLRAGRPADAAVHLRVAATGFQGLGAASWAESARALLERARPGGAADAGASGPGDPLLPPPGAGTVAGTRNPRNANDARDGGQRLVVTLGDLLVRSGSDDVHLTGHVGRAVAFVATRGSSVHVDELAEALWPEVPGDVGRARLRNVLSRSRKLTDDVIVRDGDVVGLAPGVVVDVVRFEALAAEALRMAVAGDDTAAELARSALAYYGGEFVPTNRYDDWAAAPRERIERLRIALMELLADDAQHRGAADEMLAYIERAIEIDPYDEDRYLRGAQALVLLRRRGPALRLIERAAAMVRDLGLEPGGELTALRSRIVGEADG